MTDSALPAAGAGVRFARAGSSRPARRADRGVRRRRRPGPGGPAARRADQRDRGAAAAARDRQDSRASPACPRRWTSRRGPEPMSRSAADEAVRLLDDIFGAIYDAAFRGCGDASGAVRTPTGLRSPAQSACASTKVRDDPASIPTLGLWPVGEIQRSSIDLGCNLTRGHRPLVSRRARSTHHGPFGIMIFNSPNEPGTREPASHPGLLAGDLVVPDVAALTGSAGSLQQDAEVTAAVRGVGWGRLRAPRLPAPRGAFQLATGRKLCRGCRCSW